MSMMNSPPYVVLADDDPDDQELFCSAMRCYYPQINVRTFHDGDELLAFLETCTMSSLPALILIDYKMPRISAPQILQVTGPNTPYAHIPKIVWSTSERRKDNEECLHLGANRFVIKPDTNHHLDQFIKSLEEWLDKPAPIGLL